MSNEFSKQKAQESLSPDNNEAVIRGQELANEQIKKSTGFLSFVMNDKTSVEVRNRMQEAALIELNERVRAFKLHSEANIQRLEEEFNNVLINVKAEERAKLVVVITSRYNNLIDNLNKHDSDFNAKMEVADVDIEKIRIKQIKEKKIEAFQNNIDGYFNMRNEMVSRFENLVKEIIKV